MVVLTIAAVAASPAAGVAGSRATDLAVRVVDEEDTRLVAAAVHPVAAVVPRLPTLETSHCMTTI